MLLFFLVSINTYNYCVFNKGVKTQVDMAECVKFNELW